MLYWLLYQKLYPYFHPFRIFRFITFRTAFASATALLIALFIGPYVIQKLRDFLERHRRPLFERSGERGMRELPSGTVTFLSNDVAHLSPFQVLVASYLGLKRLSGCRV